MTLEIITKANPERCIFENKALIVNHMDINVCSSMEDCTGMTVRELGIIERIQILMGLIRDHYR